MRAASSDAAVQEKVASTHDVVHACGIADSDEEFGQTVGYALPLSQLEIKLVSCGVYTVQSAGKGSWSASSETATDEGASEIQVAA